MMKSRRRNSVMQTAPVLGARLEIQNLISSFSGDYVDIEVLVSAIRTSTLSESMDPAQISQNLKGVSKISMSECEILLRSLISTQKTTEMPDETVRVQETKEEISFRLVEMQKMVVVLDSDSIEAVVMEPDDPRLVFSPEYTIAVLSNSDAEEVVRHFCDTKCLQDTSGNIFDAVEKASLQASQNEIRDLDDCIEDYFAQLRNMASLIGDSEEKMMAALSEMEKKQFVQTVMKKGHRRRSVCEDIQQSQTSKDNEDGPARLAKKLHDLQVRTVKADAEFKRLLEFERQSSRTGHVSEQSQKDGPRAKWRRETDSDLSRKKMLNDRRYSRNEECKSVTKALDIAADVNGVALAAFRNEIEVERSHFTDLIASLHQQSSRLDAEIMAHSSQNYLLS